MTDCSHTGDVTLNHATFVLTCDDCGEGIPKGHFRKLRAEQEERTGVRIRPPRPGQVSGRPHWDYSGYEVSGGFKNCGADQT